ncbi:MAG TPA: glycosyltransferase [Acidimicrobiales bacterium]|jgi:glycosyltransferase involved in cell wall biosynthesis/GT2 family glycosyltransferase|nr:glycosyltransferase [Acidimicrobiales bacterium]
MSVGMRVDVVVVTHQSAVLLPRCLDALPPSVEVVVVDNASTDASAEVAASQGATVIRNTANLGFARAANQGAARGDGELILFLNPDASIVARDLEELIEHLGAAPARAVVGPRLVAPDGREQRAWWPFPSAPRAWAEALGLLRLGGGRLDRHREGFVVGACLLVRRDVFEQLGGFDERFWLYGEEADLCRRVRDAGWEVALVAGAVAEHVGGASGEAAPELVFEHFCRGTEHFVAKHSGAPALVGYRLALLTGSLLRLVALLAAGRWGAPVKRERARIVARLARVLSRHPTRVHRDTAGSRSPGPPGSELVVCSLEAWDETWRRNQFLVRELLARDPGLRVLFVEPAHDVAAHLLHGRWPRAGGPRLRRVDDAGRVLALRPVKVLPRALGPFADRSLRRQVRSAARRLGLATPTLWVNDSTYASLGRETGWPSLYDVTDDWLLEEVGPRERRRREHDERQLLSEAGVVVVCSPALRESRGAIREVVLVPNAVDVERFRSPRPRPADLPAGRTAVYVGSLHDQRLDVSLVEQLAAELADLQVVLVGPNAMTAGSTAQLAAVPNVHLLGARPHDAVPAYLQHADVVIVPHLVTPFTESLDPIKAYECLAIGTPTVATPLVAFGDLGEPVRTSPAETFAAEVRRALEDPPSGLPATDVPTWDQRAGAFAVALEQARRARHDRQPSRRRVVYLDHCAQLSGGELALLRLLLALEGVEAHVILAQDGPLVARLRAAAVSVEVLPMAERARSLPRRLVRPGAVPLLSLWDTAAYVLAVRARLRQLRPDLVHTNSLKAALYGSMAARLAGIPVVCHVRDRIADDYLPGTAARVVRVVLRVAPNMVIANSRATLAALGARRRPGVVVPSPVMVNRAPSRSLNGHRPTRALRVGMVGRLARWKGQHLFLDAFARAFPGGEHRAVLIGAPLFGEDSYEEELRTAVDHLGIGGRVEFTGFVDDVPAELARLDLLVHASVLPEPFGLVVVEGMAAGLPVVAAAAGGPLEVVTDGVDGRLFAPGDVAALAAALAELAADPRLRARLGSAARVTAAAFSPERVAAATSAAYDDLLSAPRRAGAGTRHSHSVSQPHLGKVASW